jgi:hypothetical protein
MKDSTRIFIAAVALGVPGAIMVVDNDPMPGWAVASTVIFFVLSVCAGLLSTKEIVAEEMDDDSHGR